MNLIQSAHTLKSRSGKEFGKAWTVTSLDDAGVDELLPAGVEVGGRGAVAVGGRAVAAASSPAAPVLPPRSMQLLPSYSQDTPPSSPWLSAVDNGADYRIWGQS